MTYRHVAHCIYKDTKGRFYERPRLHGKATWHRLYSLTLTDARKELATKRADHHRAPLGLARDPYRPQPKVAALLDAYLSAGCPTPRGLARAPRTALDEARRLDTLRQHFGTLNVPDLTFERAKAFGTQLNAPRSADLHLYTLRNAFRFAVQHGRLDRNPLESFPRFRSPREVKHCRGAAPTAADEFHQVATFLLQRQVTEPLAWQWLLQGLTGCRTSEILALQMHADSDQTPGFIEDDWLWLKRSKGGVNPFALITPQLRDAIAAHHAWHEQRYPKHPHWIPHRIDRQAHADPNALNHALKRATATRMDSEPSSSRCAAARARATARSPPRSGTPPEPPSSPAPTEQSRRTGAVEPA